MRVLSVPRSVHSPSASRAHDRRTRAGCSVCSEGGVESCFAFLLGLCLLTRRKRWVLLASPLVGSWVLLASLACLVPSRHPRQHIACAQRRNSRLVWDQVHVGGLCEPEGLQCCVAQTKHKRRDLISLFLHGNLLTVLQSTTALERWAGTLVSSNVSRFSNDALGMYFDIGPPATCRFSGSGTASSGRSCFRNESPCAPAHTPFCAEIL